MFLPLSDAPNPQRVPWMQSEAPRSTGIAQSVNPDRCSRIREWTRGTEERGLNVRGQALEQVKQSALSAAH